jgi:hypothetical protein
LQSLVRRNKAIDWVDQSIIEKLARKYRAGAGAIDMAVRTALIANGTAREGFLKAIEIAAAVTSPMRM